MAGVTGKGGPIDLDMLFSSTAEDGGGVVKSSASATRGNGNGGLGVFPAGGGGAEKVVVNGGTGEAMMGGILDLINKLQQACAVAGDTAGAKGGKDEIPSLWEELPSMVVVGGQSSGKSSVLEAIVGRDFLPRGSGIVTRRPLVLQLINDSQNPEFGEFTHKLGQQYTDFDQIRNEIEAETTRSLGGGKAVSPIPINLTIHSPNVPNLTLVDMPGLTKIPISGQPASIVRDIEDMARQYIEGQNAIILAVSPANADLATSDAIRLASDVDPSGERTIGVLTKIDIMDRGTDARGVLMGETFPLRHGWVGVVNRSQHDIDTRMSMDRARKQEMAFFDGDSKYASLRNVGTKFLSEKCAEHLQKAVARKLPQIQEFLDRSLTKMNAEMRELGEPLQGSRGALLHQVLSICQAFEKDFKKMLESGKGGGENILNVFEVKLKRAIRSLPVTTQAQGIYSPAKVARVVMEADGYQPHLVAPEQGYRRLIEEGLELAKGPALMAVDEVHVILRAIIENVFRESKTLDRFANLREEVKSNALKSLDLLRDSSKKMVQTLVEMEGSYLTAAHFKKIMLEDKQPPSAVEGGSVSSNSNAANDARAAEFLRMGGHVAAYVQHVLQVLETTIPKAIVHCQIVEAKAHLLQKLEKQLADKELKALTHLLTEDPEIAARRAKISKRMDLLVQAKAEVSKVL